MAHTVLIVDDAPIIRMMLRGILIDSGYEIVGEASDGMEAVGMFKEMNPDLVSMDILMPEKNGIEAIREIIEINPEAKIVVVTGVEQKESLEKALAAGAVDHIFKPFEADQVISVFQKALGEA